MANHVKKKVRNPIAIIANTMSGGGYHTDKRKRRKKNRSEVNKKIIDEQKD